LEAEVKDPEEWEQMESDDGQDEEADRQKSQRGETTAGAVASATGIIQPDNNSPNPPDSNSTDNAEATMMMDIDGPGSAGQVDSTVASAASSHATSLPMAIPGAPASGGTPMNRVVTTDTNASTPTNNSRQMTRTPSPTNANALPNGHEGPITPRNDAGPWVFDGSGPGTRRAPGSGRASTDSRRGEMRNLDTAASEVVAAAAVQTPAPA